MRIEEIDRYCDIFEERLRSGAQLAVEQFLKEQELPSNQTLLVELRKLEQEYAQPSSADEQQEQPAGLPLTGAMPPETEQVGA